MTRVDWPEVCLGEVIDIKHGFAFKGEHFANNGQQIVVTPGNFYDEGGFKLKEPEKYYTGAVPPDFILEPEDVLVVMTEQKRGLLGSAGIIPSTGIFLHNQRLGRVVERDSGTVSRRFLYYAFNSPVVRSQIQATANGAKVRHTSPTRIKEVTIRLPPLEDQEKISAVLAAYDELIENNLRRIEILEEMSQAIYREWFVNFRYPGHETDEFVDSPLGPIPAGWQLSSFLEIAEEVKDGIDPEELEPDTPYVGLDHIPRLSFTFQDVGIVESVTSRKWRFRSGDILFGKLRPYFHKVAEAPFEGVCSTDAIVIRPALKHRDLALMVAFSAEFVAHAVGTSGGTDRPRAKWVDLATFPVVLPSDGLNGRFSEVIRPMIDLAANLARQNAKLREARDLLLPKLVSGEIDVSDLDIDTSWLAA